MLIGGIVLTIAIVQLLLITLFKQHLDQEILEKSHQLSTRIVEFAVDNINFEDENVFVLTDTTIDSVDEEHHQTVYKQLVDKDGNCKITKSQQSKENESANNAVNTTLKLECDDQVKIYNFNTDEQNPQIKKNIAVRRTITQKEFEQEKVRWKKQLHQIIESRHADSNPVSEFSFVTQMNANGSNAQLRQPIMPPDKGSASIDSFINYMIYLILASSLVALILAFWLSNHFTKPLRKLSNGFEALQCGQFGIQVEVSGINEYRKTIGSFNQMSQRLAQLAESEKVLQQQSHLAELGEVSRGLAHALRNPMHTIGLSVEQLKDPALPSQLRVKLQDKIQNKINHIDKTIKAMLTLTSGEINREEAVPIRSVIQDIILEMKANDPSVSIDFNHPEKPFNIKGAESEIRAILHTLIVNAIEANNNSGKIEIILSQTDTQIQIDVLDQGKGLDQRIKDRLFQPHISTKSEGAGMGLYISRRLATLYYQGDITIKNRDSGGCRATASLNKETK